MRAQAVAERAGRGRAASGKAGVAVQRPAPRRGRANKAAAQQQGFAWKSALRLLPLVAKLALFVFVVVLGYYGYRTAASAAFFKVKTVDVEGTERASRKEIEEVVQGIAGRTGVWRADLETISEEIERLPWVRSAVVTRVLPSGVRVRVTERAPAVIARTQAGRLVWVDDEGVVLGVASPGEDEFFVRGLDERRVADLPAQQQRPTEARGALEAIKQQNRERVRLATELAHEWQAANLSRRVSEINLEDLRDVRVQLAGADAHVEVRLGKEDYAKRFRQALEVLDAQRGTARGPFVTYIDVSQGKRAVVGTGTNAHVSAEAEKSESATPAADTPAVDGARGEEGATTTATSASRATKRAPAKRADERKGVKRDAPEREKRNAAAPRAAGAATRPRRAG